MINYERAVSDVNSQTLSRRQCLRNGVVEDTLKWKNPPKGRSLNAFPGSVARCTRCQRTRTTRRLLRARVAKQLLRTPEVPVDEQIRQRQRQSSDNGDRAQRCKFITTVARNGRPLSDRMLAVGSPASNSGTIRRLCPYPNCERFPDRSCLHRRCLWSLGPCHLWRFCTRL